MKCPFNDDNGVCLPSICPLALRDGESEEYYCSFAVLAQCATERSGDEAMGEFGLQITFDPSGYEWDGD